MIPCGLDFFVSRNKFTIDETFRYIQLLGYSYVSLHETVCEDDPLFVIKR